MNKIHSVLAVLLLVVLTACSYNDKELQDRFDDIDSRVEQLEAQIQNLNSSINEIYTIVKALDEGDKIVSVLPIKDGYVVSFSKSGNITIRNGKDGVDGQDGVTPVVSARQDADGSYYWTVNGEYLLDKAGKKLPVTSHITPKLRLEGDNFEISYDNGKTWEVLGAAGSIPDGALLISSVKDETDKVTFVLSDGQTIVIPKVKEFSLSVDASAGAIQPGSTSTIIPYRLVGADKECTVDAFATGGFEVTGVSYTIADDPSQGTVEVKVPSPMPENGKVFIFGIDGKGVTVSSIVKFEKGVFEAAINGNKVPAEGGEVVLMIKTNYGYSISIPDESKSWISTVQTKAVTEHAVTLIVAPNTGAERKAVIGITRGIQSLQTFEIVQEAAPVDDNASKLPIEDWKNGGSVNL